MSEPRLTKEQLQQAIAKESEKFTQFFTWVEGHMPPSFFEEVDQESIFLIVHALMGFLSSTTTFQASIKSTKHLPFA